MSLFFHPPPFIPVAALPLRNQQLATISPSDSIAVRPRRHSRHEHYQHLRRYPRPVRLMCLPLPSLDRVVLVRRNAEGGVKQTRVASAEEELFIRGTTKARGMSQSLRKKSQSSSPPPAPEEHFDFVQQPSSSSSSRSSNPTDPLPSSSSSPASLSSSKESPSSSTSSSSTSSSTPPSSSSLSSSAPAVSPPDNLPPLSETQSAQSSTAAAAAAAEASTSAAAAESPTATPSLTVPSTSAPIPAPSVASSSPVTKLLPPPTGSRMIDRLRTETKRVVVDSELLSSLRIPSGREAFKLAWEVALVITLLTLLRAGVSSTLRWIHTRLNATRGLQSNMPYEDSVFECMQRPLEFLSLFTVGTAIAEAVSRPLAATGLLRHIRSLRELGIIIAATWFLLRWIDRIRSRFAVDKRIDKPQLDATSRFAKVATFIVSMLISLDTIGVNVQAVLAFGGIGGVAIGFAGREIISNFFGGFMIYVTRPFTVGEWIRCIEESQLNGTVEDIGWYLTRVRTWDKRPLYIPNSRFSTLIVENGSRMDNRRILHTVHLRHEDLPVVPTIVSEMEAFLLSHPALDTKQHRMVYVDGFDDFSVKIWFSCYTKSVFFYDFRRVQQEMLLKFHEIVRSVGAKLATRNTRDVRPGLDTDRYGPLGVHATYGQPQADKHNTADVGRGQAANDVPGSPPYRKVRKPSDPVIIDRTNIVDARPAHGRANAEQSSTSAAAVAAAAAALVAARRNASRLGKEASAASTSSQSPTTTSSGASSASTASLGNGASNNGASKGADVSAGVAAATGHTGVPVALGTEKGTGVNCVDVGESAASLVSPKANANATGTTGVIGASGAGSVGIARTGPGAEGDNDKSEATTAGAQLEMQISAAAPRRSSSSENTGDISQSSGGSAAGVSTGANTGTMSVSGAGAGVNGAKKGGTRATAEDDAGTPMGSKSSNSGGASQAHQQASQQEMNISAAPPRGSGDGLKSIEDTPLVVSPIVTTTAAPTATTAAAAATTIATTTTTARMDRSPTGDSENNRGAKDSGEMQISAAPPRTAATNAASSAASGSPYPSPSSSGSPVVGGGTPNSAQGGSDTTGGGSSVVGEGRA